MTLTKQDVMVLLTVVRTDLMREAEDDPETPEGFEEGLNAFSALLQQRLNERCPEEQ